MRRTGIHNSKGYTLIEVMVSMAILGIIIIPLAGLFLRSTTTNKLAQEEMEAGQLAQSYMERLRAQDTIAKFEKSFVPKGDSEETPDHRYVVRWTYEGSQNLAAHSITEGKKQISSYDLSGGTIPNPELAPITDYKYSTFTAPAVACTATFQFSNQAAGTDPVIEVNGVSAVLNQVDPDNVMIQIDEATNRVRVSHGVHSQDVNALTPLSEADISAIDPAKPVCVAVYNRCGVPVKVYGAPGLTRNLKIYLIQGYNATQGVNYSDSVTTEAITQQESQNVSFIRNLLESPPSLQVSARVYKLTVTVFRKSGNKEIEITSLSSFKRME